MKCDLLIQDCSYMNPDFEIQEHMDIVIQDSKFCRFPNTILITAPMKPKKSCLAKINWQCRDLQTAIPMYVSSFCGAGSPMNFQ